MDTLGRLHCENGEDVFNSVVDWYRWERANVREEVRSGNYHFEDDVRLDHLENSHFGTLPKGIVKLTHDYNGFTMEGTIDGQPFHFNRPCETTISCHIEYNYKHRGNPAHFKKTGWDHRERRDGVELRTLNDNYYAFPMNAQNVITKIHLATEELYDYMTEKKSK
jgi:hypothetical protein